MKTKQEVIEKAWIDFIGQDLFEKCKDKIDLIDGKLSAQYLCFYRDFVDREFDDNFYDRFSGSNDSYWRPKSLKGIEDNNGWLLSDELPENAPIDQQFELGKFISENDFYILDRPVGLDELHIKFKDVFTHFRPIEKHLPPHF